MKTFLIKKLGILAVIFVITSIASVFAQTAGSLSFTVTTTSTSGYSPKHLLAIWIGNSAVSSSSSFIKTRLKYGDVSNDDHLQTWVTSSGGSLVDAVSGATLATHGTITFLWNGTDVSGTVVTDGSYYTWLEMAWASSLTTGKTVNSFQFTKGPAVFHSAPANTANLLSMALDWTPSSPTAIPGTIEYKELNIYPNPTSGILNLDFKLPQKDCQIRILNSAGVAIYTENVHEISMGIKTLDLTFLPAGVYYCILHYPHKDVIFNTLIKK